MSLGYVMWKNGEKFWFMDESARGGRYFRIKLHRDNYKNSLTGYLFNFKNEHIANFPNGKVKKFNDLLKKVIGIKLAND